MKKNYFSNANVITFLTLLFITSFASAQKYVPFPTKNAFWTSSHCEYSIQYRSGIVKAGIFGDTTIHGKTYHKVYIQVKYANTGNCTYCNFIFNRKNAYYYMAFREQNKKIYVVPNGLNPNGNEYLVYDFTPHQVGDTVRAYAMQFFYAPAPAQIQSIVTGLNAYPVKSISFVCMSDGSLRKKYVFDPFQIESWIEGIGSTKFMDPFFHITDIGDQLRCFSANGVHLLTIDAGHNCDLHNYSCELTFRSWRIGNEAETGIAAENAVGMELYPNPVNRTLTINGLPENAMISIRDLLGNIVYSAKTNSVTEEINVSDISAGVYIILVSDEEGNCEIKRFIKE